MQQIDLQQIFLESANEVLETMFFIGIESENAGDELVPQVSAELSFHGVRSGKFGVQHRICNVSVWHGKWGR